MPKGGQVTHRFPIAIDRESVRLGQSSPKARKREPKARLAFVSCVLLLGVAMWTYWEGDRPWWIDVCLRTLQQHGVRLLTPETVGDFLNSDLIHSTRHLTPAHRADVYRAALLADHGGWWFDADTILLREPPRSDRMMYGVWTVPPHRVLNGIVFAPKGSPAAAMWRDHTTQALKSCSTSSRVSWTTFGEACLTPAVAAFPDCTQQYALSDYFPIDVDSEYNLLLARGDWRAFTNSDTVAFGLNGSRMRRRRDARLLNDRGTVVGGLLAFHG